MPRYMRMTRDELIWQIENSVRWGCAHRIYSVLEARGDFRLYHAVGRVPKFTVVVVGFEEAKDESGRRVVETEGEIRVLFGNSDQGVYLKDLDLEFRPFIICVKDGHCLDTGSMPSLPSFVSALAQLPTKEAVIEGETAEIRFYRPLTGWEGFLLGVLLTPYAPRFPKIGDLNEICVEW
jgi:hypothetical protein